MIGMFCWLACLTVGVDGCGPSCDKEKRVLYESVTEAYRGILYLQVTLEVKLPQKGVVARAVSLMGPDRLETKFWFGQSKKPAAEIECRGNWVVERRLDIKPSKTIAYTAPLLPCGTNDFRLGTGVGLDRLDMCLVASALKTWLGDPPLQSLPFLDWIREGQLRPPKTVDGKKCQVIFLDRGKEYIEDYYVLSDTGKDFYWRQDELYFGADGFLHRWDTLTSWIAGVDPKLERRREFEHLPTVEPFPGWERAAGLGDHNDHIVKGENR